MILKSVTQVTTELIYFYSNALCTGLVGGGAEVLTSPAAQQTSTRASFPAGHTAAWRRWHWKQMSSSLASPPEDTGTCESGASASLQTLYLEKEIITGHRGMKYGLGHYNKTNSFGRTVWHFSWQLPTIKWENWYHFYVWIFTVRVWEWYKSSLLPLARK